MIDGETVFGECRRCGEDATLSAAHPDGVFRDVCVDCYMESLESGFLGRLATKYKRLTQMLTRF